MVFALENPAATPARLTQSVLQITDMLGMYQAELARILRCQCTDIGRLASGRACLQRDTPAWRQALLLVECYQLLFRLCRGEEAGMINWLRRQRPQWQTSAHLMMVDHGETQVVIDALREQLRARQEHAGREASR